MDLYGKSSPLDLRRVQSEGLGFRLERLAFMYGDLSLRSIVTGVSSILAATANRSWRRVGVVVFSVVTLPVVVSSPSWADVNPQGDCWIDAATGKQIKLYPPGTTFPMHDPNHVSIPGHRTFVRQPDDTWVDAATGQQIILYPPGTTFPMDDPNHVSIPGHRTFVRVPCPQPTQSMGLQPALPVLPFSFGFGLGIGNRAHGDDRFQK